MDSKHKKNLKAGADALDLYREQFQKLDFTPSKRPVCWEYMQCRPEVYHHCSAYLKSAGRRCWLMAGSLCGDTPSCVYLEGIVNCKSCDYYQKIKKGEI